MAKRPRKYPPLETYQRIKKWCDLRERCQSEVRSKLYDWGLYSDEVENLIAKLISDNYLDESRFASAYVSGKYRIKHWGKNRIVRELKQRDISSYNINAALKEIDEDEYLRILDYLIEKKVEQVEGGKSEFERNGKIARFLINRGFEPDLVWQKINSD
ncbi:regulatory protein RecX [Halocola ammonii]